MKKRYTLPLLVLFILAIAIFLYIRYLKSEGLPDYNQDIKITGLKDKVTVYRDAYAVPHIVAQNEADLYKVTGYVTAQDRLWQMDLLRRVTQGRLSEIFGEDLVDTDVLLRKLRIPDNSHKLFKTLDARQKEALQNFAAGVNQYISDHRDELPFEFTILDYKPEAWQPEHSLNLVGYMAWSLEFGYKMEAVLQELKDEIPKEKLEELLPDYQRNNTLAYPSFAFEKSIKVDTALVAALDKISNITPDIFNGSNNWVVSGKKSTTGKPIFSNDMHLGLNVPGIWSQMHQMIPGKLNVSGVILPGAPFIVAGHNEHISWGMTNVMLDGADFYVETINPDDRTQYKFNGVWKDMEVRHEKIFVKDEKEPVEKDLYFTHRGPIFNEVSGMHMPSISMHWIGNEDSREIEALYQLNRAKNWDDFTQAIKGFNSVSQNIAYADTEGNIGIHLTGHIPKRIAPGYQFFPGDTDRYDWKGFVPFDSLPYEYNPKRGYVSSANNKSVGDDYPYYISEWYDMPYRIKRIRQMLTAKDKLSTEDFRQMLFDHHSVQADEIKPVLIKYISKIKDLSATENKALQMLKDWNNNYETNQAAPLLFDLTLSKIVKNLTEDEMDEATFKSYFNSLLFSKYLIDNAFSNEKSAWADNIKTPEKETFSDIIALSFKQTVSEIQEKYGDIAQVKWGDIHQLKLMHPIGKVDIMDRLFHLNRTYPAPGGCNTVNPFTYTIGKSFDSEFGASEKHIFNTADYDQSYWVLPTGVSGIPGSKHYLDQSEMYVTGSLHLNFISLEKVKDNAVYISVFTRKDNK